MRYEGKRSITVRYYYATVKSEWLHHQRFETRAEAMSSIFYYVEVFYNRQRRHSYLGYVSPDEYEEKTLIKNVR